MDGKLPGFVRVGDRVGAAFREVAVLAEELDGDVDGIAGARGALGHQAANAVADAAVLERHDVVLINARAGVGDDHDAVFIHEPVGEGGAGRIVGLGPEEAVGLFNLRDRSGGFFKLDHFTLFVGGGGHPVLGGQNAAAVVFVMADENVTRSADVLADDHGRAGGGVETHGTESGADGKRSECHLKIHLVLLK